MFSVQGTDEVGGIGPAKGQGRVDSKTEAVTYIGYVGGLGGEAIQMFELAAGVAARGVTTRIIVPDMPGTRRMAPDYANRPNLSVELTPLIRFDTPAQNPRDVLQVLKDGTRRSANGHIPLLHLHTGDICLPRLTLLALLALRGVQAFATIHCPYPEMAFGGPRARFWAVMSRRLAKVICPSGHGRDTQVRYGVPLQKAVTIYNGVDLTRFGHGNREKIRSELGLAPGDLLVVATARLYDQKRPLDTVDAFARIAPDFPQARLAMVGAGPLEQVIRTRIAERGMESRVVLAGHRTDVPDWLAASDAWLCTSDAENFSLSVLEAMAAGCAVVGTFCRGNDEILLNNQNALTAPPGDVAKLAEGLQTILSNPALAVRMRTGAWETVRRFSREVMVEKHLALYRGTELATL